MSIVQKNIDELGLNEEGLTPQQSKERDLCLQDLYEVRRKWISRKLCYLLIREIMYDHLLQMDSLSESEAKFYRCISNAWSTGHLQLAQKNSTTSSLPLIRNIKSTLSQDELLNSVTVKVDCRLQLIKECFQLNGLNNQEIVSKVLKLKSLRESLKVDNGKKLFEFRVMQATMAEELHKTFTGLYNVFSVHRRQLQTKLNAAKVHYFSKGLTLLQCKLESLLYQGKVKAYTKDGTSTKMNEIKQLLQVRQDKISKATAELELLLSNYYAAEDSEYRSIVDEYGSCQKMLNNRICTIKELDECLQ